MLTQYLYRHDSRDNGDLDSNLPTVIVEVDESLSIKEELSDDEVCPGIHFLLQVSYVLIVGRAVGVAIGVACSVCVCVWVCGGVAIRIACSVCVGVCGCVCGCMGGWPLG